MWGSEQSPAMYANPVHSNTHRVGAAQDAQPRTESYRAIAMVAGNAEPGRDDDGAAAPAYTKSTHAKTGASAGRARSSSAAAGSGLLASMPLKRKLALAACGTLALVVIIAIAVGVSSSDDGSGDGAASASSSSSSGCKAPCVERQGIEMQFAPFSGGTSGASSAPLAAGAFVPYAGYAGGLSVAGSVVVMDNANLSLTLTYDLQLGEANATGGVHIHAGKDCSQEAGAHYYTPAGAADPWAATKWVSGPTGAGKGSVEVSSGHNYYGNLGHTVVVHGADGTKIACGILERGAAADPRALAPSTAQGALQALLVGRTALKAHHVDAINVQLGTAAAAGGGGGGFEATVVLGLATEGQVATAAVDVLRRVALSTGLVAEIDGQLYIATRVVGKEVSIPLTPSITRVLEDSALAAAGVATVQDALALAFPKAGSALAAADNANANTNGSATAFAGLAGAAVSAAGGGGFPEFDQVLALLDFVIPAGTFDIDAGVGQAQVTVIKARGLRKASLVVSFDPNATCEGASQPVLCKLVQSSGIAKASPQMALTLQHGPEEARMIEASFQVGPITLSEQKCGGGNQTTVGVARLEVAELYARGAWPDDTVAAAPPGSAAASTTDVASRRLDVLSRGSGLGVSVDLLIDISSRADDAPCGRMLRPVAFSGVLTVQPRAISGVVALQGLVEEPFGLRHLYLTNLYLGLSFGLVEDFTLGGQIEAEGHLSLGPECYVASADGHDVTRVVRKDRVCIEGTVALGVTLSPDTGISPEGTYIAASIAGLTVGNIVKIFAAPEVAQRLDEDLPGFVKASGFPGTVAMSFSATPGGTTTLSGRAVPGGLYFNGMLNFLGYGIRAEVSYYPARFLHLTAVFDRFDRFAPLFVLTNPHDSSIGPKLNVSIVHDYTSARGVALAAPTTSVSAHASAQIEILGTKAMATLEITDTQYTLDVALKDILGIKQLAASVHLEAEATLGGLKDATFNVSGQIALEGVKIPGWVADTIDALRGLVDSSPVKALSDQIDALELAEDREAILKSISVPGHEQGFEDAPQFKAYMSGKASELEAAYAGLAVDELALQAGFELQHGWAGNSLELHGVAALLGEVHAFSVKIEVGLTFDDVIDIIVDAALALLVPDGIAQIIHGVKDAVAKVRRTWSTVFNSEHGVFYSRTCSCAEAGYKYVAGTCHAVAGDVYDPECNNKKLGMCFGWEGCRPGYSKVLPMVCACAKFDLFDKRTVCDEPHAGYSCGSGLLETHCVVKFG